jgi:hypothetical protein
LEEDTKTKNPKLGACEMAERGEDEAKETKEGQKGH